MRILAVLRKSAIQQVRDRTGLVLTLFTTPAMVLAYGLVFEAHGGGDAPGRPFHAAVPGLLCFSIIMLIYSTAMGVAREVEAGAFVRLRLTPLTAGELLAGMGSIQLVVGLVSYGLALVAARLAGFESKGALGLVLALGALGTLSSVGAGLMVAALSESTQRAFLIASVAMFVLLIFSGSFFPRPEWDVVEIGGRSLGPFDLLPTTHLSRALAKVVGEGVSFAQIRFEVLMLAAMSVVSLVLGVVAFGWRRRLRASPAPGRA